MERLIILYVLYSPMREGGELFLHPTHPVQRRYEAMRAYLYEGKSAAEVGKTFGYTPRSVAALALKFRSEGADAYFRDVRHGRKDSPVAGSLRDAVIELRKQNLSVTEIAERLTDSGRPVGHQTVWLILRKEGMERLPRRTAEERSGTATSKLPLPVADASELDLTAGRLVQCRAPLLLLFAQPLSEMDFGNIVTASGYRGTSQISAQSYLLSMLLLKLHFRERKIGVMNIADDEGVRPLRLPERAAEDDSTPRLLIQDGSGAPPHTAA